MSLWTPDGERPVQRGAAGGAPSSPSPEEGAPRTSPLPPEIEAELAALTPEDRARAEALLAEMAEVQQRIAQAPAEDVVANHLMGIYELGAIHLQQEPPHFEEATIAIDAMRAVLDVLGERLGEHEATMRQALQQLQMAFVQLQQRERPSD